jgi:uncharacterized FAD-dependent dehydrogenase
LVKAKNLTPEEKADTDKHINDCESYLHGSKPTESPKSTETSKSVVAPPRVGQSPPFQAVVSYPATGAAGSGLRTAGLLVAGVGGAGLIAGLILNLKVNSMSSDLEGNYGLAADATRKNYKTAGWIAYGAGSACLAGGAVLYYLGWRRERSSSFVALRPTVGPDIAGAVLVGAF